MNKKHVVDFYSYIKENHEVLDIENEVKYSPEEILEIKSQSEEILRQNFDKPKKINFYGEDDQPEFVSFEMNPKDGVLKYDEELKKEYISPSYKAKDTFEVTLKPYETEEEYKLRKGKAINNSPVEMVYEVDVRRLTDDEKENLKKGKNVVDDEDDFDEFIQDEDDIQDDDYIQEEPDEIEIKKNNINRFDDFDDFDDFEDEI